MALPMKTIFCRLSRFSRHFRDIRCVTSYNTHQRSCSNDVQAGQDVQASQDVQAGQTYKRQVFSGIQPTGTPHIGNYIGAIRPWVELQQKHGHVILSVVDLHSITVPGHHPTQLRENIVEMFATLLACGIDNEKTLLFQQSAVLRHGELAWILGCMVNMSKLHHLPQWKVKSESLKEIPLGVFTYPVLQAADILLYKATEVPVGDDQVKHIELARDIAKSFNHKYGQTFPLPRPVVGTFNRIKSLRSPLTKMSKSDKDVRSYIQIIDSPDVIQGKLKKAVTDFTSYISYEPIERPGVSNLVNIHAAFTGLEPEEICEQYLHLDTLGYKTLVADIVIESLAPVRTNYKHLMENRDHLENLINTGNIKARQIAEETYSDVIRKVGFL